MAELYSLGKRPTRETVDEIIAGLEAMGNYIPDSELIRREYRDILMKEYKEFVEIQDREKANEKTSRNSFKKQQSK